jgi:phosphatidylserine decarboxylase
MTIATPMETSSKARLGGWLPQDPRHIEQWLQQLRRKVKASPKPLISPIATLRRMVYTDPVLYASVQGMFTEANLQKRRTPLNWQSEPMDFEEFLLLLNAIMLTAPEAYQQGHCNSLKPSGLIGFPINALLDWPMGTSFGHDVFSNALINQQFKKILNHWSNFLASKESRYVLVQDKPRHNVLGWLDKKVQEEMVEVAKGALGPFPNPIPSDASFADIFCCKPNEAYYGYKSWDDFFTRAFRDGVRPISGVGDERILVNACESAPLSIARNVALSDTFWIKEQCYSLENMLNWDELTPDFDGGTVYQAFLSALSYHRWHSPVNGTIKKAYVVNGSYYLENQCQAFLTAVATRALIFIEADNPDIGLMCVMPVGMAEVSSCEISVQPGQRVKKGDQLGMFHFGGSTHCLIFRPEVNISFTDYQQPGLEAANVRVNSQIAVVASSR